MEPVKFDFDLSFDEDRPTPAPRRKTRFSAEEVEAIRAEAYEAGRQSEEVVAAQALTAQVALIAEQVNALAGSLHAEQSRLHQEGIQLAAAIGHKLCAGLETLKPAAEIEAFFAETFSLLRSEPNITVCVPSGFMETLAPKIEAISASLENPAGLRVVAQGDAQSTAVEINWAAGSAVFDQAAIASAVEDRVARFLGTLPEGAAQ